MSKILILSLILPFTNVNNKVERLEDFRQETLELIRKHTSIHPECMLNDLYLALETIEIHWFDGDRYTSAYLWNGKIYINKNIRRSKRDVVVTILHELIHLNICGSDTTRTTFPICKVFDVDVYYSTDISNAIRRHIKI